MCAKVGWSANKFRRSQSAKLLTYQFLLLRTLQYADLRFEDPITDRRFAGPIILQTSAKPGKKYFKSLYVGLK